MPFDITFLFFKNIISLKWSSCRAVLSGAVNHNFAADVCQCPNPTLTYSFVPGRDDIQNSTETNVLQLQGKVECLCAIMVM